MSEFIVNDDMFGLYARIPTGFSHERHIYKIIARIESNSYCDLPLGTCNTKQTRHGEIVPVLLVIHCGLDETEVVRIKEADCEIVNSHLREVAELTELLNASKAGQVSLQKAWEQDKADLTTRAEKAEAEIKSIHEALCFADKCRLTCTNYTELAVSNGLALGKIAVAIQHDYDAEPPKEGE